MLMNPSRFQMPDEAFEAHGNKVNKCKYCNSYNISLDSSTGKIVCNNSDCTHMNEKQDGVKENFDQKIDNIRDAEKKDLQHAIMRGDSVKMGSTIIPGINSEPKIK